MTRHQYERNLELALPLARETPGIAFRTVVHDDGPGLATLMLDAYRGTIDDEGETIDAAVREVHRFFAGRPLLLASFVARAGESLVGACLVTLIADVPLVAYVMTASGWKRQGIGAALVQRSLDALAGSGHAVVRAAITEGNEPSERMCRRAGFRRIP